MGLVNQQQHSKRCNNYYVYRYPMLYVIISPPLFWYILDSAQTYYYTTVTVNYTTCICRHVCECIDMYMYNVMYIMYWHYHMLFKPTKLCTLCNIYSAHTCIHTCTMTHTLYITGSPSSSSGDEHADHDISNRLMRVIWSHGQVFPDYFHWPRSGIEAGTAPNEQFYQPDEIKYHGGRNRGVTSLNFFG